MESPFTKKKLPDSVISLTAAKFGTPEEADAREAIKPLIEAAAELVAGREPTLEGKGKVQGVMVFVDVGGTIGLAGYRISKRTAFNIAKAMADLVSDDEMTIMPIPTPLAGPLAQAMVQAMDARKERKDPSSDGGAVPDPKMAGLDTTTH